MDILSGSYSRQDRDMAGTFQVLWGGEDGFKTAETLNGADDEPLIIPASQQDMTEKICTRPFAADIDADGHLDLVVGNFAGSFYVFTGQGKGKFDPKPTKLENKDGKALIVKHHSDPCMYDWDGDGDLDIVSGSDAGGVSLSVNEGTLSEPSFAPFEEIIEATGHSYSQETKFGTAHLTKPQSSTRVWIDDVNNDGKFDLLVGDTVSISNPAEGVEEDKIDELLEEWQKEYQKVSTEYSLFISDYQKKVAAATKRDEAAKKAKEDAKESEETEAEVETEKAEESSDEEPTKAEVDPESEMTASEIAVLYQPKISEWQEKLSSAYAERNKIVEQERTGFVWVYYQK